MERRPILTCPDCGEKSYMTDWLPPEGIDPRLREFKCDFKLSDHIFYKVISAGQAKHLESAD